MFAPIVGGYSFNSLLPFISGSKPGTGLDNSASQKQNIDNNDAAQNNDDIVGDMQADVFRYIHSTMASSDFAATGNI